MAPAITAACGAQQLSPVARVLAAADAWCAMTEPRAHRPARTASDAARELREQADAGKLAGEAVDAVLESVGERARPRPSPGRAHGSRGRGAPAARARAHEQAGCPAAGDLAQDRRAPRRVDLLEDRRLDACRGGAVRRRARPAQAVEPAPVHGAFAPCARAERVLIVASVDDRGGPDAEHRKPRPHRPAHERRRRSRVRRRRPARASCSARVR